MSPPSPSPPSPPPSPSTPPPPAAAPPSNPSSSTTATTSRLPRKSRLVVPADTLLTFTPYTPPPPSRHPDASASRRLLPSPPSRPRDAFVQANYRFVVSPHRIPPALLRLCAALHDAVVPWPAVDVVFVPRPHMCPICLQAVRCPRVTPCGHVFDFVCILQHFSHDRDPTSNNTAKCPLCSSRVEQSELKMCAFREKHVLEVGLPFAMTLVNRERGRMIATVYGEPRTNVLPTRVTAESPFYSRLGFADEKYLMQLVQRAIKDLRDALRDDPALQPFVDTAMAELIEKKTEVRSRLSTRRQLPFQPVGSDDNAPALTGSAGSNAKDLWFFYQASDTQNIFLHPVNHRCLSTEFAGDFSRANANIEGDVLQIDRHTMDESLRRKYRFLEHLPDGCEFAFVELALNNMLSASTLATHEAELKERSTLRKRKQHQAKRENRRIEKKKTESLQEYFSTQAGHLPRPPPNQERLNSRDVNSFPALRMDVTRAVTESPPETRAETSAQIGAQIGGYSPPGGEWGGAEVSSYSSVTSNMGLFPSLGRATTGAFPALGAMQPPLSPTAPRSPARVQGAWGPSSSPPSATTNVTSPPEESRRRKRSQGRTTILLSNARTPYRR